MAKPEILIAYATKRGSAKQAAEWIAEELGDVCDLIDLKKQRKVDIGPYKTIVLGSGIQIGRAYKPLNRFIKRFSEELKSKDVCIFLTHLEEGEGIENDFRSAFDTDFLHRARVRMGVGGRIRLKELNFLLRMTMRRMGEETGKDFEDYDTLSREECIHFVRLVRDG